MCYQKGATDPLDGDGMGRRSQRHYVPDPCRGAEGQRSTPPRLNDANDNDGEGGQYIFRDRQRRQSHSSSGDEVSVDSENDVFADTPHHGDVMPGRRPTTMTDPRHLHHHATSSISSGTGQ